MNILYKNKYLLFSNRKIGRGSNTPLDTDLYENVKKLAKGESLKH